MIILDTGNIFRELVLITIADLLSAHVKFHFGGVDRDQVWVTDE